LFQKHLCLLLNFQLGFKLLDTFFSGLHKEYQTSSNMAVKGTYVYTLRFVGYDPYSGV
jgi:hypothetical protein